jgi:hypothetical protein
MLYLERLYRYCGDSKKVLWLSAILGCLFMLTYALFCFDMYDDVANCYAPMVRDIGNGKFHQAFKEYWMIAPLLQTFAGILCYLGIEPYTATIIISGIFYILTIFPLYSLLRRFTTDNYAAWGVFAYIIAPKIIRFSGTGILNSGRNLFAVWATYLLLSFFDDYKFKKLIWLGVSLAGLALIRGEGIGFIPLFGLMFVGLFFFKHKAHISFSQLVKLVEYGAIVGIVILAIISPRLIQMYQDNGYPVIDRRQSHYLYFLLGKPPKVIKAKSSIKPIATTSEQLKPSKMGQRVEPPILNKKAQNVLSDHQNNNQIIADTKSSKPSRLQHLQRFITNVSRGSYEFYLFFALIGLILIIKRRQWNYEYYILLTVAVFNGLMFYDISIAYRYFTLNLLLFMPFTLVGIIALTTVIKQKLPAKIQPNIILIIIACLITLIQIHNGMVKVIKSRNYYYFKQTGEWLKSVKPENRRLSILSIQPQYAFWADAQRQELDLRKKTSISQISNYNFDYIVLGNKRQWLIEKLTKEGYQKVLHPYENKVTIFAPINSTVKK